MTSDVSIGALPERPLVNLHRSPLLVGRQALLLWIALAASFALIGRGSLFSSDEGGTFNTALSLVQRRNLAIGPNENVHQGPDGKYYACREIFPSLLCIPPAVIGSVMEVAFPNWPPPRANAMIVRKEAAHWPLFLVASLLGPLALSLTIITLRAYLCEVGLSPARAWTWALAVGWSTPLLYYSKTIFGQVFEAALLMLALHYARRWRTTGDVSTLTRLGVVVGLGVMTRAAFTTVAFWIAVYLLIAVWTAAVETPYRKWRYVIHFLLPVALGALMTAWVNWLRWRSPIDFGYHNSTEVFSTSFLIGGWGSLFSPGKGLLLYAPLLWLVFSKTATAWRADGRLEILLVGAISSTYWVLYGRWADWHGGLAWGPRFLVPLVPLWVAVTGPAWRQTWTPRFRIGLTLAIVLGVLVQFIGISVHPYWIGYHKTDAFSWTQGHLVREAWLLWHHGINDLWLTNPESVQTRSYFPLVIFFLSGIVVAGFLISREIKLAWNTECSNAH